MVLPIKTGIIYGPVNSRRLGKSLGINLMPERKKYCDFDCLYCHYGRTKYHRLVAGRDDKFPSVDEVLGQVDQYLKSNIEFNYLTFSGNGEPTLHPEFKEIARECKDLARTGRPHVKVTLLSNSSTCTAKDTIEALDYIDLPIMKLDAGTEELFNRINCPVEGIEFKHIVDGLKNLANITIQTLFLTGDPDNSSERAVESWFDCLTAINPIDVQIYTLDRPFARRTARGEVKFTRVDDSRMAEIVKSGRAKYGLSINRY